MVLSVSVIYCYVTSKPKTQCFKTTAFIIFQVLWIKTGLGGSSGSLALTSLQLSQALTGKGPLQAPSQSGCKVQFLAGCWTKALFSHSCWPKTTPSSLLCEPFHRIAHHKIADFIKVRGKRVPARESLLVRLKSSLAT